MATAAVAGLASATNTNEALFLMKKYFQARWISVCGNEVELYQKRQDDLLRRLDKHPNTQGAIDLGPWPRVSSGLRGLRELAEKKADSRQCGFHFIRSWSAMTRRKSLSNCSN